mgnify:CR=1 FL=1
MITVIEYYANNERWVNMSVSVINEPHKVRVRKPHICQGCGKKIEMGEEATSSTFAEGRDIWTFYECEDCRGYFDSNCNGCRDFEYCIGENYFVGTIKECKRERMR